MRSPGYDYMSDIQFKRRNTYFCSVTEMFDEVAFLNQCASAMDDLSVVAPSGWHCAANQRRWDTSILITFTSVSSDIECIRFRWLHQRLGRSRRTRIQPHDAPWHRLCVLHMLKTARKYEQLQLNERQNRERDLRRLHNGWHLTSVWPANSAEVLTKFALRPAHFSRENCHFEGSQTRKFRWTSCGASRGLRDDANSWI